MSLGNRESVEEDLVYEGGPITVASGSQRITSASAVGVRASGLALAGVVTILLGIWGGIVPFIGPTFGYSADGSVAWNMTSAHLWLAVIPGAAAFVSGLLMLMIAPRTVTGSGRLALLLAGLLGVFAGAWFVVGAAAWPVLTSSRGYFVPASALRELAFRIGYGWGPGLVVVLTGAFALGWCARHQLASPTVALTRRHGAHSVAVSRQPTTPFVANGPQTNGQIVASDDAVVTARPAVSGVPVTTTQPVVVAQPVVADQPVVSDPVVAE